MKKLIFLALAVVTSSSYALDLEDNVKNFEKSGDWASFSLVDSYFGRIVATRATTEDKRTNASLALTYPTSNKCQLTPIDIIVKLETPQKEESSRKIFGNIQVDNNPVKQVEATLQNEADSEFIFITIDKKGIDKEFKEAKSFMVNFKGYGVMDFSLNGAKSAIDNALSSCRKFSF